MLPTAKPVPGSGTQSANPMSGVGTVIRTVAALTGTAGTVAGGAGTVMGGEGTTTGSAGTVMRTVGTTWGGVGGLRSAGAAAVRWRAGFAVGVGALRGQAPAHTGQSASVSASARPASTSASGSSHRP